MLNDRLALDFTWMFTIRLKNVPQKLDQFILIHSDFFSYKYPSPSLEGEKDLS